MTDMSGEVERGDIEPTPRDADAGEAKEGDDTERTLSEADDREARFQEALEKEHARAKQLRWNTRAIFRAMEGWRDVRSEEDWMKVCEESRAQYESGQFLL